MAAALWAPAKERIDDLMEPLPVQSADGARPLPATLPASNGSAAGGTEIPFAAIWTQLIGEAAAPGSPASATAATTPQGSDPAEAHSIASSSVPPGFTPAIAKTEPDDAGTNAKVGAPLVSQPATGEESAPTEGSSTLWKTSNSGARRSSIEPENLSTIQAGATTCPTETTAQTQPIVLGSWPGPKTAVSVPATGTADGSTNVPAPTAASPFPTTARRAGQADQPGRNVRARQMSDSTPLGNPYVAAPTLASASLPDTAPLPAAIEPSGQAETAEMAGEPAVPTQVETAPATSIVAGAGDAPQQGFGNATISPSDPGDTDSATRAETGPRRAASDDASDVQAQEEVQPDAPPATARTTSTPANNTEGARAASPTTPGSPKHAVSTSTASSRMVQQKYAATASPRSGLSRAGGDASNAVAYAGNSAPSSWATDAAASYQAAFVQAASVASPSAAVPANWSQPTAAVLATEADVPATVTATPFAAHQDADSQTPATLAVAVTEERFAKPGTLGSSRTAADQSSSESGATTDPSASTADADDSIQTIPGSVVSVAVNDSSAHASTLADPAGSRTVAENTVTTAWNESPQGTTAGSHSGTSTKDSENSPRAASPADQISAQAATAPESFGQTDSGTLPSPVSTTPSTRQISRRPAAESAEEGTVPGGVAPRSKGMSSREPAPTLGSEGGSQVAGAVSGSSSKGPSATSNSATVPAPVPATHTETNPSAGLVASHTPIVTAPALTTTAHPVVPHTPAPASANLLAWQNYEASTGTIVRSAQLTGTAGSTEMHVQMRSGALGPVEVRATLNDGTIGAEIHVKGQEAHSLLSAGLPTLERAMGEHNVRVESLSVYQDASAGNMSGGNQQGRQSGAHAHAPAPREDSLTGQVRRTGTASSSLQGDEPYPASGLSVHA